ncbi:MAG TPA: DUF6325 family protein [Dehalococcoidia bacterium]|jgi:hypothetical protein|nr:DUF6325 family protein [Dehalococcoidia bacterium]
MGPLQYMVVSFEGNDFSAEILPELQYLCDRDVIRVLDLVFVSRDTRGAVSSHELRDLMPEYADLISGSTALEDSWFALDDIDLAGDSLPDGSSVVLLLFEHVWATRLDESVRRANGSLIAEGLPSREVASQIERLLTLGV